MEFSLIAAPLIAILLSILQTALVFFLNENLQTLAEQSARQIMTGTAQNSSLTQSQFQTLVCQNAPTLFQCNNIMVDVESYSAFNTVNTAPLTITYNAAGAVTNSWSYSPGNAGDIVIVRIMYEWPIFGGPLGVLLANQSNSTRLLVGTTVLKNEPYQ